MFAPLSTRSGSSGTSINQAGFILITAVQSAVVRSVRGGEEAEGRGRQEVKEEVGGGEEGGGRGRERERGRV